MNKFFARSSTNKETSTVICNKFSCFELIFKIKKEQVENKLKNKLKIKENTIIKIEELMKILSKKKVLSEKFPCEENIFQYINKFKNFKLTEENALTFNQIVVLMILYVSLKKDFIDDLSNDGNLIGKLNIIYFWDIERINEYLEKGIKKKTTTFDNQKQDKTKNIDNRIFYPNPKIFCNIEKKYKKEKSNRSKNYDEALAMISNLLITNS